MLGLGALVGSIALADSVNPSTVIPALYLSRRPDPAALARFIAGVFVVYLAGGLVLVLGPGPALIAALRNAGPLFDHVAEAAGGVALLAVAALAWHARGRADGPPRSPGPRAALLAGAGISAVELPTAFMYFGAVSAVLGAHVAIPARIGLMVGYNVVFAAPLLVILAVRLRARDTASGALGRLGDRLRRAAPGAAAAVSAAAGAALLAVGTAGLA